MKRLIIKLILFILYLLISVICVVLVDVYFVGNQYEQGYNASILDKITRLKNINTPKIILVGNSNLAFGINSKLLEEKVHMPVVNLGLHGGMGNAFHENIAKPYINKGDIVIVCHNEFADNGKILENSLACITLEKHKELWRILELDDYFDVLKAYPSYMVDAFVLKVTKKGNRHSGDAYDRAAFNEYGDIKIYREEGKADVNGAGHIPAINENCVDRLNNYNNYIVQKGAVLLIAAYPIAVSSNADSAEQFEKFRINLQSKLKARVISNYEDYFFDHKYIYDWPLHLTSKGADIRTELLANDIKRYLNKE